MLKIKISHNEEARRFAVEKKTSFSEFSNLLSQVFGTDVSGLQVQYFDEEGDLVQVSTEMEWRYAVEQAPEGEIFKMKLVAPKAKESAAPKQGGGQQQRPAPENPWAFLQNLNLPQQQHRAREQPFNWAPLLNMFGGVPQQQPQRPAGEQQAFNWEQLLKDFMPREQQQQRRAGEQQPFNWEQLVNSLFSGAQQKQGATGETTFNWDQLINGFLSSAQQQQSQAGGQTFNWEQMLNGFLGSAQQAQQAKNEKQAEPAPAQSSSQDPQAAPTVEAPASTEAPVQESQPATFAGNVIYPPVFVASAPTEEPKEVPQPQAQVEQAAQQEPAAVEYQKEFDVLAAMGFTNIALNTHLLKHFNGNMNKVIESLLSL